MRLGYTSMLVLLSCKDTEYPLEPLTVAEIREKVWKAGVWMSLKTTEGAILCMRRRQLLRNYNNPGKTPGLYRITRDGLYVLEPLLELST